MPSPYEILRVSSSADDGKIDRAYRERVKETHPDLGGDAAELRAVIDAYEALKHGQDTFDPTTTTPAPTETSIATTSVEYLNYDVITDHDWDIDDTDLFTKANTAGLNPDDYGEFTVYPGESLLVGAERCGHAWPFACRGGACANCAVIMKQGDLLQPPDHILPDEMTDQDIRLSCNGIPTARNLKVIYNAKHRADLDDLRLPPYPFERTHANN